VTSSPRQLEGEAEFPHPTADVFAAGLEAIPGQGNEGEVLGRRLRPGPRRGRRRAELQELIQSLLFDGMRTRLFENEEPLGQQAAAELQPFLRGEGGDIVDGEWATRGHEPQRRLQLLSERQPLPMEDQP
jgi:hypothetical protein